MGNVAVLEKWQLILCKLNIIIQTVFFQILVSNCGRIRLLIRIAAYREHLYNIIHI